MSKERWVFYLCCIVMGVFLAWFHARLLDVARWRRHLVPMGVYTEWREQRRGKRER